MSEILGSGLAFPIHVDARGQIALASGEEDIDQAIGLILSTAPGERPLRPHFGCEVHDLIFDVIDAATIGRMEETIRVALDRWEPRVEVTKVDFDLAEAYEGKVIVMITYVVRTSNHMRNLVYPFYVIPAEDSE